jgi:hypothetical protein
VIALIGVLVGVIAVASVLNTVVLGPPDSRDFLVAIEAGLIGGVIGALVMRSLSAP